MINLTELKKLSDTKADRDRDELIRQKREAYELEEAEYQEAISNLEQNLRNAANAGKRELKVAHFSAFKLGNVNVTDELKKIRGNNGNYYVAWQNKTITERNVIDTMTGNLKRTYLYLKENHLNPSINYWTNERDEGFELIVSW